MSEDQEPLRSRRALRRAREAQVEQQDVGPSAAVPPGVVPPSEQPSADTAGQPAQPPAEQPSADTAGQPSQPPAEQPSADTAEQPSQPPVRSRRRVAESSDAGTGSPRERSSQTRARDRQALRTYKELADQETKKPSPLTRRQLRQQQLDAERRAAGMATGRQPIVPSATPPDAASVSTRQTTDAGQPSRAGQTTRTGRSADAEGGTDTGRSEQRSRRAGARAAAETAGPGMGAQPATSAQGPTSVRPTTSADTSAGAAPGSPAETEAGTEVGAAAPVGRGQQRRSRAARDAEQVAGAGTGSSTPPDETLNELSIEQALAARAALIEQAKNQVAMIAASKQQDPLAVDLEVLAEQKKLAERAAVLNQRAQTKQRLAEESQRHKADRYDPASTSNLAMVTPLEFVRVPGVDQPVMQAPATSHIPVITSSTQRVPAVPPRPRQSSIPHQPAQVPPVAKIDASLPPSVLSGDDPRNASGSRSHVLAHAEAVASTRISAPVSSRSLPRPVRPEPTDEGGPVSAHTAHGLEPLDASTAKQGGSRGIRLLQFLIPLLGSVALVVGLIMVFGG